MPESVLTILKYCFLALVYLFLLGWVDKTARQPREIEHRLKLPVVATIPELKAFERL